MKPKRSKIEEIEVCLRLQGSLFNMLNPESARSLWAGRAALALKEYEDSVDAIDYDALQSEGITTDMVDNLRIILPYAEQLIQANDYQLPSRLPALVEWLQVNGDTLRGK